MAKKTKKKYGVSMSFKSGTKGYFEIPEELRAVVIQGFEDRKPKVIFHSEDYWTMIVKTELETVAIKPLLQQVPETKGNT